MACNQPTSVLYETITTTVAEGYTVLQTQSIASLVVSGDFPSSVCVEYNGGQCISSTLQTLAFTYTTYATYPQTLTTNAVRTVTSTVPTLTLYGSCSASQVTQTLPNGSVTVSSIYVTVTPTLASNTGGSRSNKNGAIIGGAVGGAVALSLLLGAIWFLWRRNRQMRHQLKAAEEEEKRNTAIDVGTLLPSPYTEFPRNQSATPTFGNSPYSPYSPAVTHSARFDGDPSYGHHTLTQEELALTGGVAPVGAMSAIGTTQYTPTHSRAGSFVTQDPTGRPQSTTFSAIGSGGVASRRAQSPEFSSASPISGDGRGSPSMIYSATESSQAPMSSAASAKAREAFQTRRSALYAQNQGEEGESYAQDDIVMPANATRLRSAAPPPSAWAGPPPAYTPDHED